MTVVDARCLRNECECMSFEPTAGKIMICGYCLHSVEYHEGAKAKDI